QSERHTEDRRVVLAQVVADLVLPRPRDVRDHEGRSEEAGEQEDQGEAADHARFTLRSRHREARRVVHDLHTVPTRALLNEVEPGQARVVDIELLALDVGTVVAGLCAHDLPAIHSAEKIRTTMPTRKMTRPSATGPILPIDKPPGLVSDFRFWMYAMMSCFSCGLSWLSPKTGMFCGPVSIAA